MICCCIPLSAYCLISQTTRRLGHILGSTTISTRILPIARCRTPGRINTHIPGRIGDNVVVQLHLGLRPALQYVIRLSQSFVVVQACVDRDVGDVNRGRKIGHFFKARCDVPQAHRTPGTAAKSTTS